MSEASNNQPLEAVPASEAVLQQTSSWQSFRRIAGKVALAGAILTPFAALAGEVTDAKITPPAHVSTPIAGGEVTAKAVPNSNLLDINLQAGDVQRYSQTRIAGKDIGADITFHFDKISLGAKSNTISVTQAKAISQEFSDLHPEIQDIESAMKTHYEEWGLGAAVLVYAAGFAGLGWWAFRQRQLAGYSTDKRKHVLEDRKWPSRVATASVLIAAEALLYSGGYILLSPNHTHTIAVDHALDGTVLAGSGISGPAEPVANSVVPWASKFFKEKNTFYGGEAKSFQAAFKEKYGATSLKPQVGEYRIIFADDFQGEDGPAGIVGDAAKAYNANLIINGGDITATGSPLETPVLDTERSHAGNIPIEINDGHHDPPAVMQQMAKGLHIYVGNNSPMVIHGINVMGINAPDVIPFASEDQLIQAAYPGQTISEATQALIKSSAQKICAFNKPLIVANHDQAIGTPIAETNCASIDLTGRQLPPHPPIAYGHTEEFISGSTGGHGSGSVPQVLSIIHNHATFQEVTIKTSNYQEVSSDLITLLGWPSTGVTIANNPSIKQPLPNPYAQVNQLASGKHSVRASGHRS